MTAIKMTATDLKAAIPLLKRCIQTGRKSIPVLKYVKIEATNGLGGGLVSFATTDLDAQVNVTKEASISGDDAAFMLPFNTLADIAGVATAYVTFETGHKTATKDAAIKITCDEITVLITDRMPVEDFPSMDQVKQDEFTQWEMGHDDILRLINLSRHCVSTEETRYYLNGLYLTNPPAEKDAKPTMTLRGVATDGYRLAVIDTDTDVDLRKIPSMEGQPGFILPSHSLDTIAMIARKGGNSPLQFRIGQNRLMVIDDRVTLITKLIDGIYPDYTRVLPKVKPLLTMQFSAETVIRLNRLAAADRMYQSRAAKIDFKAGTISIRNSLEDAEVSAPMQCSRAEGAADHQGFNIAYLADLGRVTGDFTAKSGGAGDPAICIGDDTKAMWVLMPMPV